MSDYFGALMRASGISLGISAAAGASARDAGLDVERGIEEPVMPAEIWRAPGSEPPIRAAAPSMQSSWTSDAPQRERTDASESAVPAVASMLGQHADRALEPTADFPGRAERRLTPDRANTGTRERPEATPQALIQAALQWVATGSATEHRAEARASDAERITSIAQPPAPQPDAMRAMERGENGLMPPSPPIAGTAASAATPSRATGAARAAHDRSFPDEASEYAHPSRRGEAIEVSIGAIHVRVDAPTAQTVARPAVPAAPAMLRPTAAVRAPQSSRLARRALRRI